MPNGFDYVKHADASQKWLAKWRRVVASIGKLRWFLGFKNGMARHEAQWQDVAKCKSCAC